MDSSTDDNQSSNEATMPESSSTSIEDEEIYLPKKRYKKFLYADHQTHDVSQQTKKRWEIKTGLSIIAPLSTVSTIKINNDNIAQESSMSSSVSLESTNNHDSSSSKNNSYASSAVDENNSINNDDDCLMNADLCDDHSINDRLIHHRDLSHDDRNDLMMLDEDTNTFRRDRIDTTNATSEYEESNDENVSGRFESDSHEESQTDTDYDGDVNDNDLDKIMFANSNLSVRDISILIKAFSLRFRLSDEARTGLAELMKLVAGPDFETLSLSKYTMDKCFSSQKKFVTYIYYCDICQAQIVHSSRGDQGAPQKYNVLCAKCNALNKITSNSMNYFVQIDLKYQIQQVLANKHLFKDIFSNLSRREVEMDEPQNGKIRDVHDGQIYRKMMSRENDDNYCVLSINAFTDGAPLSNRGKRSFSPFQVILNDLSIKLRFRHILLTGIIVHEHEPKPSLMNLFLTKVFVEPVTKLYNETIVVRAAGQEVSLRVRAGNLVCDSKQRPVLQNRLQFNGKYGCSWCYQEGTYIHEAHGIRYLCKEDVNLRDHASHMQDVIVCEEKRRSCIDETKRNYITFNGVKGPSALQALDGFDMVWGFSYEILHGLFLGAAYQLWNDLKTCDSEYRLDKKTVRNIERRYLSIKPTHDIHRLPRSGLLQGTTKPKASEMKSWILLYCLPCLEGYLNDHALQHLALLVKSAYDLSKLEITDNELLECEANLHDFVESYEVMFGEKSMTYNIHILTHCAQCVREAGPCWANSAFAGESEIYDLKQHVNGPKGAEKQMSRKHLESFVMKSGDIKSIGASQSIINYCKNLFTPRRLRTFYESEDDVTFCGKSSATNIGGEVVLSYKKCIHKGTVYHSIQYKRAKRTDDTVIKLSSGIYARIIDILQRQNECLLRLSKFEIYPEKPFPPVEHIRKVRSENEGAEHYFIVSIKDVQNKIVLVNVRNGRYLCTLPNTDEIQ